MVHVWKIILAISGFQTLRLTRTLACLWTLDIDPFLGAFPFLQQAVRWCAEANLNVVSQRFC